MIKEVLKSVLDVLDQILVLEEVVKVFVRSWEFMIFQRF